MGVIVKEKINPKEAFGAIKKFCKERELKNNNCEGCPFNKLRYTLNPDMCQFYKMFRKEEDNAE